MEDVVGAVPAWREVRKLRSAYSGKGSQRSQSAPPDVITMHHSARPRVDDIEPQAHPARRSSSVLVHSSPLSIALSRTQQWLPLCAPACSGKALPAPPPPSVSSRPSQARPHVSLRRSSSSSARPLRARQHPRLPASQASTPPSASRSCLRCLRRSREVSTRPSRCRTQTTPMEATTGALRDCSPPGSSRSPWPRSRLVR